MQALHVGVCSTIAPSQKHFKQKTIRKPIYPQNTSQSIFHDLHNCKYCGGAHSFILCTKYWPSMLALAQIHDARIYIRNQEIREHLGEHLTDPECELAWFHQELLDTSLVISLTENVCWTGQTAGRGQVNLHPQVNILFINEIQSVSKPRLKK